MIGRPRVHAGVVEDGLAIDIDQLARAGSFDRSLQGTVVWLLPGSSETLASLAYAAKISESGRRTLTLKFHHDALGLTNQVIDLAVTSPFFGGLRYWFQCPIRHDGRECGARIRVLYLPVGAALFGCRECHDLTYSTCRESHKFDRLFAGLARLLPRDSQTR